MTQARQVVTALGKLQVQSLVSSHHHSTSVLIVHHTNSCFVTASESLLMSHPLVIANCAVLTDARAVD